MAASANAVTLADLFDPEVVADFIDKKLIDYIRFAPLARVDNTLVGRAGDKVKLPSFSYIGDAEAVAEGADIPIAKLTQTTEEVEITKIGRAVEITDEALLSGYGTTRIAEEAADQVSMAINSKVESMLISAMSDTATLTYTVESTDDAATNVAKALNQFGEDIDGDKVIVVPPSYYTELVQSKNWIPNTEIGADIIIRGTVGQVHGCQVVVSNRLTTSNTAYIVKPNALAIFMKRDTLVEFDRDKLAQLNYIIGSKLFAPYVYDKTKLIKVGLTAASTGA